MSSSVSLCNAVTVTSLSSVEMECNQLKSVVSLVDSLVRSAHARRTRILLPSLPVRTPSLTPVSSKLPTDFSICSILGLQNDVTQSSPSSESHSNTSAPLTPYSDCTSPSPSHRQTSPLLTPYSDMTSSSNDCDSELDQAATDSEELPRKKRQRTTFSLIEVWELERAFRRRPYLTSEDEKELVQRLGITAKSLKYWFQNRRAKSSRLRRKLSSAFQTNPSNQFELPANTFLSRGQKSVSRSSSDHWKQGMHVSCRAAVNCLPHSRPIATASHHPSVKSNQFRGDHSFPLPMFHPDQFKIGPAEPARLPHSRALRRFQPY